MFKRIKTTLKERDSKNESIIRHDKNNLGSMVEKHPYYFSPVFMKHNGKYLTMLTLYVRPGSNRQMSFIDVLDFIPSETYAGVEMYLITDDTLLKDDEKKRIIRKNSSINKETMKDADKHAKKEDNDQSVREQRRADTADYNAYERLIDSAEPVVVFKWRLIITGPSREKVEEQVESLNISLDQMHEGARWDNLPGEILDDYPHLFRKIDKSRFEMTSSASNYAGLNLVSNAGLNDPQGMPVGIDVLSQSGSSAYFDFEHSTHSQAIIAMPRKSQIGTYELAGSLVHPQVPSLVAQYAANQIVLAGHRAHHIVLNDFNYFESKRFYRPREINTIFANYDVSKVTINPLQGFGHDFTELTQVYNRLIRKVVNIMNVLNDFQLTAQQQAIVLDAVNSFYFDQSLWVNNADKYPETTNIINIVHPEKYPTLVNLMSEFSTLAKAAATDGRENKADEVDTLSSLLNQALTANTSIVGRPTSIKPTDAVQTYYSFANITDFNIRHIQFLNLIDYVIYTAQRGDVIVIHGFDSILSTVSDMVLDSIKAAQKNGIRFIFTFDSLSSPSSKAGKMNDMFEMQQKYYTDLDTDIDWSFIGRALPAEMKSVRNALNQELGLKISAMMQAKTNNQVLIHRNADQINNFIGLNFVI